MIAPIRESYRQAPWRRQQWALARRAVARVLFTGPPAFVPRYRTRQAFFWMGVTGAVILAAFAFGLFAWLAFGRTL